MSSRGVGQLTRSMHRPFRAAGVFACVLVVLLLVGMLCVQTIQTLLVIRRSDAQRAKLFQAREVIELGRQLDWSSKSAGLVRLAIPQSVTREAMPAEWLAEIEGRGGDPAANEVQRILVNYPLEHPGKITATWERKHE